MNELYLDDQGHVAGPYPLDQVREMVQSDVSALDKRGRYDVSANAMNAFKLDVGGGHSYKVVRGASGNFINVPVGFLTAYRYEDDLSLRDPSVGFHLVVDVSP